MLNSVHKLKTPISDTISNTIGTFFEGYGIKAEKYQSVGMMLHLDEAKMRPPIPIAFKLETRSDFPLDSNVFFSSAPLKTKDHIELLRLIEAM